MSLLLVIAKSSVLWQRLYDTYQLIVRQQNTGEAAWLYFLSLYLSSTRSRILVISSARTISRLCLASRLRAGHVYLVLVGQDHNLHPGPEGGQSHRTPLTGRRPP